VTRHTTTTHLLFVDDVLCFGQANILEWRDFHNILSKFEKASRLVMNKEKSKLISDKLEEEFTTKIANLFGVKVHTMQDEFRYSGFNLKPNNYMCLDWDWLIRKFDKKLGLSEHKWLSISIKFVMIKVVL